MVGEYVEMCLYFIRQSLFLLKLKEQWWVQTPESERPGWAFDFHILAVQTDFLKCSKPHSIALFFQCLFEVKEDYQETGRGDTCL